MSKLPAFQVYPGDWRKDPGVQSLDFHDRGVWWEMLCLMHESERRGVLVLNGRAMTEESLSRLLGLDKQILTNTLTNILTLGVASREEDTGAIYCRRMVRDENLRQVRTESGKKGGNPNLVKQKPTTRVKQIPTPSSSSSSTEPNTSPSAREPVYDFDADPLENIPDNAEPMQCAALLLERAEILDQRHVKEAFAGAIKILGKVEHCSIGDATRRLLDRVRAAQSAGISKWALWLADDGWKAQARASPATLGMNFTPPDERPLAEQMGPEWCAKVLRRHTENKTLTGLEAEYIRSLKLASK